MARVAFMREEKSQLQICHPFTATRATCVFMLSSYLTQWNWRIHEIKSHFGPSSAAIKSRKRVEMNGAPKIPIEQFKNHCGEEEAKKKGFPLIWLRGQKVLMEILFLKVDQAARTRGITVGSEQKRESQCI
jgi:hypothetical protein